jgi:hypothetical protein
MEGIEFKKLMKEMKEELLNKPKYSITYAKWIKTIFKERYGV